MARKVSLAYGYDSVGEGGMSSLLVERGMEITFVPTSLAGSSKVSNSGSFLSYSGSSGNVQGMWGDASKTMTVVGGHSTGQRQKLILSRVNPFKVMGNFYLEYTDSYPSPLPASISNFADLKTSYTGLDPNEIIREVSLRINMRDKTVLRVHSDDPNVRFSEYSHRSGQGSFSSSSNDEMFIPYRYRYTQTVKVRLIAPSSPNTTKVVNVYIGDFKRTITLRTGAESVPSSHIPISFGHTSGNISLGQINSFFGGTGRLTGFARRGVNIPDIPANSKIRTTPPYKITDYRGAATALFISRHPTNKTGRVATTERARNLITSWNIWEAEGNNSWDLGFSPFIRNNAQFRYEVTQTLLASGNGFEPNPPIVTGTGGAYGSWSSANRRLTVTVSAPRNAEFTIRITVKFFARHKSFTGSVLTTSATFTASSVGR